jgi:hypothetical protein
MLIKPICFATISVIWNFNYKTRYNQGYFTDISITCFFPTKTCPLSPSQHHDYVKCSLSKNSRHRFFYNCLSKILCNLLYTHPLLGAHVVSEEGSGLILSEWHSWGYGHMLVVFVLLLLEETTITLKVLLWRFPFNFIWKCTIMLSKDIWHLVLEVEVYW